jgi:hypothetical protein
MSSSDPSSSWLFSPLVGSPAALKALDARARGTQTSSGDVVPLLAVFSGAPGGPAEAFGSPPSIRF